MKKIILLFFAIFVVLFSACVAEEPPDLSILDEYDFFVDDSDAESYEIQETSSSEAVVTYILNTNTKKFHLPDCSWVRLMSEKNKSERFETKEELTKKGYSPCYHCCLND